MNELVAIIVASGKSSRFGGFPKAFCEINGEKNIERLSGLIKPFVKYIYAIVNSDIYKSYRNLVHGCELVEITTGYGEAHSLLRGLKKVDGASQSDYLVCWGDAVLMSDAPVRKITSEIPKVSVGSIGTCLCAMDERPYAWFGTEDKFIRKSYFKDKDGGVETGIHDQSLFYFKGGWLIDRLERYRDFLQIREEGLAGFENPASEMKMLYAFEYFYEDGSPMEYCMTEPGQVMSFNTKKELEKIERSMTGA